MVLTVKQNDYVGYRIKGYQPTDAARLARYADNGGSMIRVTAYRLENNEGVKTQIRNYENRKHASILRRVRRGDRVPVRDIHALLSWECLSYSGRKMAQNTLSFMNG